MNMKMIEAELGDDPEERPGVEGEELLGEVLVDQAEEARPQHDPGHDLADHGRLAHLLGRPARGPGHDDDDGDAEEDPGG